MTRPEPRNAPLWTLLFFVPWLAAGCGGGDGSAEANAEATPSEQPHNVRALDLERSDLVETLYLTGRLEAVQATDVSTEESGVVRSLPVEKGAVVREGAVVVGLDRDLLEAEMNSAKAAVTLREYNEDRTRSLFEANSVSKQEMLRVYTELQQARESARMAELRYERAAIKAPFDGVLVERYVEVGEMVSPGQRVARVVDPFTLELVTSVTEREVAFLREGTPALISVDGIEGVVPGRVTYVSVEASPTSGKFTVEIQVDNPDLRLRAGVVARARVLKQVHSDALVIPRDAVVRTVEGDAVFVIEDDRARVRRVVLGPGQGMMVVVEQGLAAGERLVVRGQRQLQDGSRISVQEVATARDGSIPSDPAEVREEGNLEGLRDMMTGDTVALPTSPAAEEPR